MLEDDVLNPCFILTDPVRRAEVLAVTCGQYAQRCQDASLIAIPGCRITIRIISN